MPHLQCDWARTSHICPATGLTPATSAPGLGSSLPHLHRDGASHICTGNGLTRGAFKERRTPQLFASAWVQVCAICRQAGDAREAPTPEAFRVAHR